MYPCLVFFVLGGIIIAIFIKILEWQSTAQQIHDYAEAGGEERILPIQEEGDESVLLHMGRVVQGYTIRPRKLPCQHEETHWEIWRSWWELVFIFLFFFHCSVNFFPNISDVNSLHSFDCDPRDSFFFVKNVLRIEIEVWRVCLSLITVVFNFKRSKKNVERSSFVFFFFK